MFWSKTNPTLDARIEAAAKDFLATPANWSVIDENMAINNNNNVLLEVARIDEVNTTPSHDDWIRVSYNNVLISGRDVGFAERVRKLALSMWNAKQAEKFPYDLSYEPKKPVKKGK